MLRNWLKKLQDTTDLENRRVILDLLEPNKSARLLDLGCWDGSFTLELGRTIGTDKLYSVDIVEEFVQQCETKGIKAYCGDLNKPLPFESESFGVVHANQVLEHIHHTDLFIKEIHRVLKSGGYVVLSTPNLAAWHNVACLFWGWQPFSTSVSDEINVGNPLHTRYKLKTSLAHRRVPTYRGLKELLQYNGFKVERTVGVGYYPFPGKIGRLFSRLDPRHSVYLTVKARKT